jgi:ABC-type transport system involved in multi-copper enzyme maturation permease subunit
MTSEWSLWRAQTAAIMRLEIRKSFLNRRGFVVYLLAAMPVVIWVLHAVVMRLRGRQCNFGEDMHMFAAIFQFFFLRLFIFFGCVAIFMNLFRGEILQKSLHYYFLAPVRREVLMAGKFLAGLVAAFTIFGLSALLQIGALLWHVDSNAASQYLWQSGGLGHIAGYLAVTLLACIGYGGVFLAAGMFFRNPLISVAAVVIWEGISSILPATLQKFTIIHYLQSLAPVPASPPKGAIPLEILFFMPEPTPALLAVLGLLALTAAILVIAARRVRRMQIDYAAE